MKLYVVFGRIAGSPPGEPWQVGAYFDKGMAFEHAKLAKARAKDLWRWVSPRGHNWAATPVDERPRNFYDPNMEMTHMGVDYGVYEVPLLESIPGVHVPEPALRPTFWDRLDSPPD